MTIDAWLGSAQRQLETAGIATARLDALVLLEDCLHKDRALLLAHPDTELTKSESEQLGRYLERRATHEPLAYIRGRTEFYGREFLVNHHVLEPRPESETMVSLLLGLVTDAGPGGLIVDVGTGSGALAVTIACELGQDTHDNFAHFGILGIDIDADCLNVARRNAERYNVPVGFITGDLLGPLLFEFGDSLPLVDSDITAATPIFALVCNLPYVPTDYHINLSASHEPRLAIFGGKDGLRLYRKLFSQAKALPQPPRYILAESLPPQHAALAKIAAAQGYVLKQEDDFIQVFENNSSVPTAP